MDRLLGLSSCGGAIKMGTTLADHFGQLGANHSVLRNTDRHHVNSIAQPTATRMDRATGPFDNQAQTLQVLNSIFESHQ